MNVVTFSTEAPRSSNDKGRSEFTVQRFGVRFVSRALGLSGLTLTRNNLPF